MDFIDNLVSAGLFKSNERPQIFDDESSEIVKRRVDWRVENCDANLQEIHSTFQVWCAKENKIPEYQFRDVRRTMRAIVEGKLVFTVFIRYECLVIISINCLNNNLKLPKNQVRVDGIDYIGVGDSIYKEDAKTNCIIDFCHYLVDQNYITTKFVNIRVCVKIFPFIEI